MPTINQLSAVDSVSGSDQLPIYSQNNGDARKVSLTNLLAWINSQANTQPDNRVTQYAAPSATGSTTQVLDSSSNVWLIVSPSATFATGTIKMPANANCQDRQELLVNYNGNGVSGLTVDGNGSTVVGAPTAMAANAFFRLRFDAVTNTWYRVG